MPSFKFSDTGVIQLYDLDGKPVGEPFNEVISPTPLTKTDIECTMTQGEEFCEVTITGQMKISDFQKLLRGK